VGFGVYLAGHVAEDILRVAGPIAAGATVLAVVGFLVVRHRRAVR
jgi:hypothetical protein